MRSRWRRTACSSLLAGVTAVALVSNAHSYTLTDTYFGGLNTYNGSDVIGSNAFNIIDAVITRSTTTTTNDTLNITINTMYAGVPGTGPAEGTGYGSLFLSPGTWSAANTYTPNEWQYAVQVNQNPGSGNIPTTTSGLYAVGNVATTNLYSANTSVVQSYTTTNGSTIVMSNVNGDPVTYPGANNPGYYFRQGQAVQFTPGAAAIGAATWSVNATVGATVGAIIFSIIDNSLLGSSFALAWAMTCANDVIQGQVTLPDPPPSATPLPAALPLFAAGLGVIGFLGSRRRKKLIAEAV